LLFYGHFAGVLLDMVHEWNHATIVQKLKFRNQLCCSLMVWSIFVGSKDRCSYTIFLAQITIIFRRLHKQCSNIDLIGLNKLLQCFSF
jgi:hypothetical protein